VNFFMEIAKLRALRMLWSRVTAALGASPASQALSLHVRTSQWNKTVYDPYNNMLRATVEAFAGVLGGCDSMQVGAFDEVFRRPDDFSLRIARNTQLVLQKECHLNHIIDPAGGSWFVENLTAELAQKAWALFQEAEKLGGMEAAMRAEFPQKAVAAMATEKIKSVNRRRDCIVGVNQYANPKEKPLARPAEDARAFDEPLHEPGIQRASSPQPSPPEEEREKALPQSMREDLSPSPREERAGRGAAPGFMVPIHARNRDEAFHKRRVRQVASHRTSLEEDQSEIVLEKLAEVVETKGADLFEACVEAVAAGATLGEITRAVRISDSPCAPVSLVCITRAAAALESLRAATDRFVAAGQQRPKAFLCNMGSLRDHKARADFSRGFLSVAGYEVLSPAGFKTPEEAAEAFAKANAKIAVICSTDDNYPALVPPLVQALRAEKPETLILLAGYPQDQEAHKKSGIDDFIHIRADALELLSKIHQKLGIEL
jgi:methylmalonyl-CoA mutase